jgi:hypothetical protein
MDVGEMLRCPSVDIILEISIVNDLIVKEVPTGLPHPEEGCTIGILKLIGIRGIHLDKTLLA